MSRILFISNTANFSKFNRPFMRWFKEQGWQVDYCSAGEETVLDCDKQYTISIARSPFSIKNLKALYELKRILAENQYDILHCHTPMGGVIGRLAARKEWKTGKIKVIYTAHGFHFYKGAPFINWILYYPIEKWLANYTDVIITMNLEDYKRACKISKKKDVYIINGVGVNLTQFSPLKSLEEKNKLRKKYGFLESDFILIYTAEFIPRKNHRLIFDIIVELKEKIPELKLILCGKGKLLDSYTELVRQQNMDYVIFTGYTKDVADYCRISDILVMPSFQEGLPMAMIEAISTGIPVVASKIRGHCDIIEDGSNGILFDVNSSTECKNAIISLYENKVVREEMRKNNIEKSKKYSVEIAIQTMAKIYKSLC